MDKYEKLRNKVVWAVTHYGIVNTDGIIETLRETVLELDTDKLQNTSSNSDYAAAVKNLINSEVDCVHTKNGAYVNLDGVIDCLNRALHDFA